LPNGTKSLVPAIRRASRSSSPRPPDSAPEPGVSFQVTSFEDLDAAEGCFDLVISGAAFHWIDPDGTGARSETRGDQQMPATLKLTHKAIGAEVRRGPYASFVVPRLALKLVRD
jgi:hypothetical protein